MTHYEGVDMEIVLGLAGGVVGALLSLWLQGKAGWLK